MRAANIWPDQIGKISDKYHWVFYDQHRLEFNNLKRLSIYIKGRMEAIVNLRLKYFFVSEMEIKSAKMTASTSGKGVGQNCNIFLSVQIYVWSKLWCYRGWLQDHC